MHIDINVRYHQAYKNSWKPSYSNTTSKPRAFFQSRILRNEYQQAFY